MQRRAAPGDERDVSAGQFDVFLVAARDHVQERPDAVRRRDVVLVRTDHEHRTRDRGQPRGPAAGTAWQTLFGRITSTLEVPFDAGEGEEPHTIDRLLAHVRDPRRELRRSALEALYEGLAPQADTLAHCYDTLVGDRLAIGATVRDLAGAQAAAAAGADHVGFGPVFATSTKVVDAAPRGLELLREVCRGSPIPVVAIAGIGAANIVEVAACGAAAAAVVSELLGADSMEDHGRLLREAFAAGARASSIAS